MTENQITFIRKDMNKAGKFYVLRTFFTNNKDLERLNDLMWILDGKHDEKNNSFARTSVFLYAKDDEILLFWNPYYYIW